MSTIYEQVLLAQITPEGPQEQSRHPAGEPDDAIANAPLKRYDNTAASPLDQVLEVTRFSNRQARTKRTHTLTLRDLATEIRDVHVENKLDLPSFHLATFGPQRTEKGCLRHNANLRTITGIEIDYDSGPIRVGDAARRLRRAGIAALVHSSANSTAEDPRWHAFIPTSEALPPEGRVVLVEQANAIFEGEIDQHASFTFSQATFSGNVAEGDPVEVQLVEGDFIDQRPDLPRLPKGASATGDGTTAGRDRSGSGQLFDLASRFKGDGGTLADFEAATADYPDILAHLKRQSDPDRAIARAWERAPMPPEPTLEEIKQMLDDLPCERSRLAFLSPTECETAPARGYVVKGIIAPGDIGCIFGAPGVGKSLIAPHMGYAVAQGRTTFQMRVKRGEVFYVAAEDETGMTGRVRALKVQWGDAPLFNLVTGVSDLLSHNSADLRALLAAVKERRPTLVFIDTLAMAFPGLEENDAASMGRVVWVAKKIASHGAAVVLVHHDTKDSTGMPRGHSMFNGALDFALQLTRDDGGIVRGQLMSFDDVNTHRGQLTKNRNGTCDREIAFRIDTRAFGVDDDGDPITAALVKELSASHRPAQRLTNAEKAALALLTDGLSGTSGEAEWREACMTGREVSASDNEDSRRRAAVRVINGLVQKRAVFFDEPNGKYSTIDWGDDDD